MALSQNLSTTNNFGAPVLVPNVYIRVTEVVARKKWATIHGVILNEAKTQQLTTIQHDFKPALDSSSDNHIRQAYIHMKTLPEYANAIDC